MPYPVRLLPVLFFLFSFSLPLASMANIAKETESQRKLFLQAEKALQRGQAKTFNSLTAPGLGIQKT